MLITATVIGAIIVILVATSAFWVNWWWFGSVGYRSVLRTRYAWEIGSFFVGGLACAAFYFANATIALRRRRVVRRPGTGRSFRDRVLFWLNIAASVGVFLVTGIAAASRWELWALWVNGGSFGIDDPIFGRDVGFYVFALPALEALQTGLFGLLIATAIGVVATYALRLGLSLRDPRLLPSLMRVHVLALGGGALLTIGLGYVLSNYHLMYSTRGVIFGAGYTDVNVQRWANWALAVTAVAVAALLFSNAFVRNVRMLVGAVIAWGVLALVLGFVVPTIVQQGIVEPSELSRERPYIENGLELTRSAYALDDITARDLSGQAALQQADLAANQGAVDNIRLWDYRIIRTTYQQLQSFVPYYVFLDVDVDRYVIDGAPRQVVLAAREFDPDGLPETAQTWTNLRLVYTHGYGAVVSPVDQVSPQGLPTYALSNIPPAGAAELTVGRPEIYFGESRSDWIVVGTDQAEFSGLDPGDDVSGYAGAGAGSIALDGYLPKLMSAIHLRDRNLFISGSITGDSRLLLRRNVAERIETIAPFLTLDPDPYLVIAGGRLVWIVDAYTTTNLYPGATRTDGLNYIRNSVKVVVDAYDGTTTFYRTDVDDPIADAYGDVYGDLYQPLSAVPPELAAHFRYPEMLFDIQSEIYAVFHVTDPTAYYNGEDRWAVAQEQVSGTPARMEPYYVWMTLPQEDRSDFTLIRPFTPGGRSDRQNMTSWVAGQVDEVGRPRLTVYRFGRQETVFGPRQIEARIDQEPEISSQISLWNQSGSEVIRGNLLVIPINESVLYVQPLYLQATAVGGALPELKRVIVASSERVVMRETLDEALAALLEGAESATGPIEQADTSGEAASPAPEPPDGTAINLEQQALDAYVRAQEALSRGDWAAYGQEQVILEELLRRLAGSAVEATPAAAPPTVATPVP